MPMAVMSKTARLQDAGMMNSNALMVAVWRLMHSVTVRLIAATAVMKTVVRPIIAGEISTVETVNVPTQRACVTVSTIVQTVRMKRIAANSALNAINVPAFVRVPSMCLIIASTQGAIAKDAAKSMKTAVMETCVAPTGACKRTVVKA